MDTYILVHNWIDRAAYQLGIKLKIRVYCGAMDFLRKWIGEHGDLVAESPETAVLAVKKYLREAE